MIFDPTAESAAASERARNTLALPWERIRKVVRLEHGIQVQCVPPAAAAEAPADSLPAPRDGCGGTDGQAAAAATPKTHDFRIHLVDLDRVWLLLISLQNDNIMGRSEPSPSTAGASPSGGDSPSTAHGRMSMRRRNSDPLLSSLVRILDESMIVQEPAVGIASVPFEARIDRQTQSFEAPPASSPAAALDGSLTRPLLPPPSPQLPAQSPGDGFVLSASGLDMSGVERLAGKLSLQPIPCLHESVKGKLFAGSGAVYFFGRRYFWDRKEVFLEWGAIRHIQMIDAKTSASVGPAATTAAGTRATGNASAAMSKIGGGTDAEDDASAHRTVSSGDSSSTVCVGLRVVGKDGKEYRFVGMDEADRVWATLVSLHNENLTSSLPSPPSSRQMKVHKQQQPHRPSLLRTSSDPTAAAVTSDGSVDLTPKPSKDEDGDSIRAGATNGVGGIGQSSEADAITEMSAAVVKVNEMVRDDDADWLELQSSPAYANVVVQEHILSGTGLDEVFERFLRDGAEYSLARFLESRGDSGLRVTPWQRAPALESDGAEFSRVVHYTHPVNAPLAPPTAKARKEQRYRRFKDLGLCVWTKTIVDDVPMTDCFYVADRMTLTVLDKVRVQVRMEFEISFIKSTMFKSIISRTTSSEVTSGLQALAAYMSVALGGKEVAMVTETVEQSVTIAQPAATTDKGSIESPLASSPVTVCLLLLIVIIQVWVLHELREVKAALRLLQQQGAVTDNADIDGACIPR
jgi:hypothetical protein